MSCQGYGATPRRGHENPRCRPCVREHLHTVAYARTSFCASLIARRRSFTCSPQPNHQTPQVRLAGRETVDVATDLRTNRWRLMRALRDLAALVYVFRAVTDPAWLASATRVELCRLWLHVRAVLRFIDPSALPSLLAEARRSDASTPPAAWIAELEASVKTDGLYSPVWSEIAYHWSMARARLTIALGALPRPLRQRLACDRDPVRLAAILRFVPRTEHELKACHSQIRAEVEEKGWFPVTSPSCVHELLPNEHLRLDWPDVDAARRHVLGVCRAFRSEGRLDFEPTDEELEDVAKRHVSAETPDRIPCGSVPIDTETLLWFHAGEEPPPYALSPENVHQAIRDAFAPVEVSDRRLEDRLGSLLRRDELRLRRIEWREGDHLESATFYCLGSGEPASGPCGGFAPSPDDLGILRALLEDRKLTLASGISVVPVGGGAPLCERTIRPRLRRLENHGLVSRPDGPRKGYGITPAGQLFLRDRQRA